MFFLLPENRLFSALVCKLFVIPEVNVHRAIASCLTPCWILAFHILSMSARHFL